MTDATPATPATPPAAPVAGAKTNTLAIVTLILGILSFNIIAVILGHISLGQIKKTGESGKPLAIIGLVLGYIGIVVWVIIIIVSIIAATSGALVVTTTN